MIVVELLTDMFYPSRFGSKSLVVCLVVSLVQGGATLLVSLV